MAAERACAPSLVELAVAADPAAWEAAGFTPSSADEAASESLAVAATMLGGVRLRLLGAKAGRGIVRWALAGADGSVGAAAEAFDGLPTDSLEAPPEPPPPDHLHPNGVTAIDHVVAFSPDLDRTVATLRNAGLDFRRVRQGPTAAGAQRQAFFRVGEPLLEVIEHPPGVPAAADRDAPARFWGLALLAPDLDATAQRLGPLLGEPRDAIQPGRRIATFAREAGLGLPVVLITPS